MKHIAFQLFLTKFEIGSLSICVVSCVNSHVLSLGHSEQVWTVLGSFLCLPLSLLSFILIC